MFLAPILLISQLCKTKLQNSKYVLKSCIFIAKLHWYVKNKFNMDFIMQEYVG